MKDKNQSSENFEGKYIYLFNWLNLNHRLAEQEENEERADAFADTLSTLYALDYLGEPGPKVAEVAADIKLRLKERKNLADDFV